MFNAARNIKAFLLFCSLLFAVSAQAQSDIQKYVLQNTNVIRSVDVNDIDYSDLQPIANAIGDARLVMLGEQDHGDAPAFLAKTRLVKFLHEKMGFNVLAFESDFFALNDGWENLIKTRSKIDSFIRSNLFGVWSDCDACDDLISNYIPQSFSSKIPLQVSGVDCQMAFMFSYDSLTRKLDSMLRLYKVEIVEADNYRSVILPLIDTIRKINVKDSVVYNQRDYYLKEIRSQLKSKTDADNFWVIVLDNLIQENKKLKAGFSQKRAQYYQIGEYRDFQMAENIKWLLNKKYPGERIIVWAHNYHVSKYAGHFEEELLNKRTSMGSYLALDTNFKTKTYTIGFTSFEGEAGRINAKGFKVDTPTKNSIESWINPGVKYAFVDFNKYNRDRPSIREPFSMKASINRTHKNHVAQWNKIFDGIFYIKEMYRCKHSVTFNR